MLVLAATANGVSITHSAQRGAAFSSVELPCSSRAAAESEAMADVQMCLCSERLAWFRAMLHPVYPRKQNMAQGSNENFATSASELYQLCS